MNKDNYIMKTSRVILVLICLLATSLFLTKGCFAWESGSQSRIRVFYGGALMGLLKPCG